MVGAGDGRLVEAKLNSLDSKVVGVVGVAMVAMVPVVIVVAVVFVAGKRVLSWLSMCTEGLGMNLTYGM